MRKCKLCKERFRSKKYIYSLKLCRYCETKLIWLTKNPNFTNTFGKLKQITKRLRKKVLQLEAENKLLKLGGLKYDTN